MVLGGSFRHQGTFVPFVVRVSLHHRIYVGTDRLRFVFVAVAVAVACRIQMFVVVVVGRDCRLHLIGGVLIRVGMILGVM